MKPEWFTIKNIDSKTYAISEYGHWEKTHSYLFLGKTKALLIDSGLGIGNIRTIVNSLTNLPVTVVITHAHWDHTGGLNLFSDFGVHKSDADWLENGLPVSVESIRKSFIYKQLTIKPPDNFDINMYLPFTGKPSFFLEEGNQLNLGDRMIEVLHTPGHSPGSVCFYERETGYLATGDILYEGTLQAFYESTDPVQFADSIAKLNQLPNVSRILPGHNSLRIPVTYLKKAFQAFSDIKSKGGLRHGTGTHNYGNLSIRF